MRTVRWGIIGCGDVTEVKSGPALCKAGHSQVIAVMLGDSQRVADFAAERSRSWSPTRLATCDPAIQKLYTSEVERVQKLK